MEGSPRRSTSLNFGLSELFLGSSYPPTFNLVPNSKICSTKESRSMLTLPFSGNQIISHTKSMDDAVNSISDTKKNFVQSMTGMFGSLKNLVSNIPNLMSNINSPLSVTIVPNEGIISQEDILQNLTRSSENLISNGYTGKFEQINKSQTSPIAFSNERVNVTEMFTTKLLLNSSSHEKFKNIDDILVKTRKEDFNCTESNLKSTLMDYPSQSNSLSAIQSNNVCDQKNTNKEEINLLDFTKSISSEIDTNLVDSQHVNSKLIDDLVFIEKFSSSYSSSSDSGSPLNISDNLKQSFKQYNSVNHDLRSRKSSESSTDSDFIVFEDVSPVDLNFDYESWSDGDLECEENRKSKQFFRHRTSFHCDLRSRRASESSIDSESSCVIVFKDKNKYSDFNCKISSDEECEEDNKSGQKVRFNLEPAVYKMIKWNFAYRAARKGPWERIARDRERFEIKIKSLSQVLNPILTKEHRKNIWQIRFAVQD